MEEKDLQARMDELADTEVQLDLIISERETLKKEQIPLNVQAELESIDEEYESKIQNVKDNIKARKEQLQAMLKEFGKPLKSKRYTWSYDEEVIWDAKGLDGYALSHPEILYMRSTKPKTRLLPKKEKIL
jgi:hypothetical protein